MEGLSGTENVVLGTAAGGIEVLCNQPILYWKNASQQSLPFTLNPRFLYRGLSASITNMAVLTGIQFYGAGKIRNLLANESNINSHTLSSSQIVFSALLGGTLSGIACGPMELVMIQQQRHGTTIWQAISNIIMSHGIKNGVCRGIVTATGRESIFTAGYLGVAPVIESEITKYVSNRHTNLENKTFLDNLIENKYFGQIGAATVAGFIASGLTHPMDTIKTCMQGDIEQKEYVNIRQTWYQLFKNEGGWNRIYRGYGWRYLRMVLSTFIILRAKEHLAPVLYPQYFSDQEETKQVQDGVYQ